MGPQPRPARPLPMARLDLRETEAVKDGRPAKGLLCSSVQKKKKKRKGEKSKNSASLRRRRGHGGGPRTHLGPRKGDGAALGAGPTRAAEGARGPG